MSKLLFRIEDADGRGPFKPGFSVNWRDGSGPDFPPYFVELGWKIDDIPKHMPPGPRYGCACRSMEELKRWFSRSERRRLEKLGYEVVAFVPDRIVAETPTQVLFAMDEPKTPPREQP